MAVIRRLAPLAAAGLLVACGSSTGGVTRSGPVYLWVALAMGSSPLLDRSDWSATVCADSDCRTYSLASCQAAEAGPDSGCVVESGITVIFKYPSAADLPQHLSARIVSDTGNVLYSDDKKEDCHLVLANCRSTFIVP